MTEEETAMLKETIHNLKAWRNILHVIADSKEYFSNVTIENSWDNLQSLDKNIEDVGVYILKNGHKGV